MCQQRVDVRVAGEDAHLERVAVRIEAIGFDVHHGITVRADAAMIRRPSEVEAAIRLGLVGRVRAAGTRARRVPARRTRSRSLARAPSSARPTGDSTETWELRRVDVLRVDQREGGALAGRAGLEHHGGVHGHDVRVDAGRRHDGRGVEQRFELGDALRFVGVALRSSISARSRRTASSSVRRISWVRIMWVLEGSACSEGRGRLA